MGLCASRRRPAADCPAQRLQRSQLILIAHDAVPVYLDPSVGKILSPSFLGARQHLRQLLASSWKERGSQKQRTRSMLWAEHSGLARWTWLVQCRLAAHWHHERTEILKDLKRSLRIERQ